MYRQLETLSAERHRGLCLSANSNYRFAAGQAQVPLVREELGEAAKHFPVVFVVGDTVQPVALLGVRRDHNVFVADDGRWQAGYVPAWLRRYPFTLAQPDAGDDDRPAPWAVMIDRAAEHFADDAGQPLFTAADAARDDMVRSKTLDDAIGFLSSYRQAADRVPAEFAPLAHYDVLAARSLDVFVGDRRSNRVAGMQIVDRARVDALDDTVLADWVRSGLMEAVHAHWQSLTNFRRISQATTV